MINNKRLTIKSTLAALAAAMLLPLSATAHDFEAVNAQGMTMYFNVLSETDHTAAVTFYGDNYGSVPSDKKYSGAVIIPETVTRIIPPAVEGDEETTVAYTVTEVGDYAFYYSPGLTEITIPEYITAIGKRAFANSYHVEAIRINSTNCTFPTTANDAAFAEVGGSSNLATLYLCEGIESIPEYAFFNMRIDAVHIPSTLSSIGKEAFYYCSYLKSVYITDLAKWCAIDFSNGNANPWGYPSGSNDSYGRLYLNGMLVEDLVIPDGVTEVKPYAFYKGRVSTIDLNQTQTIGNYAFSNTNGYTALTIGDDVASVGDYAFRNSSIETLNYNNTRIEAFTSNSPFYGSNLSTIYYGSAVTMIPDYAFYYCPKITEITIPEHITAIGKRAFASCHSVETVRINSTNCALPSTSNDAAFAEVGSSSNPVTLYLCEGIESIPEYAFFNMRIDSVHIPSTLRSIGKEAFYYCSYLKSVYITDLAKWCAIDFSNGYANPWGYPSGSDDSYGRLYLNDVLVEDLVIPDGVTEVKPYVFIKEDSLQSTSIRRRPSVRAPSPTPKALPS